MTTLSQTQLIRVQMPPSYSGARASLATQWDCDGSPIESAPDPIINFNSTTMLNRVPRIRKLSAAHSPSTFCPYASRIHSRLDSKPPAASMQARQSVASHDALRRIALHAFRFCRPACHTEFAHLPILHCDSMHSRGLCHDQEKRVGTRHMECPRKRQLKAYAMLNHPWPTDYRWTNHQSGQIFIGQATGHFLMTSNVVPAFTSHFVTTFTLPLPASDWRALRPSVSAAYAMHRAMQKIFVQKSAMCKSR